MTDLALGVGLRPNPEVVAKRLDQVGILVDVATNRIFELNSSGTRVWELLAQGLDTAGIARRLVEEFDVENGRAADNVNNLVAHLRDEGLLTS
jgi:coenzyme PQQ synthesis protein D (PqqD)